MRNCFSFLLSPQLPLSFCLSPPLSIINLAYTTFIYRRLCLSPLLSSTISVYHHLCLSPPLSFATFVFHHLRPTPFLSIIAFVFRHLCLSPFLSITTFVYHHLCLSPPFPLVTSLSSLSPPNSLLRLITISISSLRFISKCSQLLGH